MNYKIEINMETNCEIEQDILDCIEEDIPEGLEKVIDNIIGRDIIKNIKVKPIRKID